MKHNSGLFFQFSEITKYLYQEYSNKFGTSPNHYPILSSLIKNENIIGIEVPVWKKLSNDTYFTGHIDLLAISNDTLIVADYKPTENEIFKSIPQICAYAYMIKQRLGFHIFTKILCVGFSKYVAWSFDPNILEKEIFQMHQNMLFFSLLSFIL